MHRSSVFLGFPHWAVLSETAWSTEKMPLFTEDQMLADTCKNSRLADAQRVDGWQSPNR